MEWNFDNDRPIYTQLLEQIELKIISGEYPLGSKMPSVRELAAEAAVNPNTMQRALQELERNGLVTTQRTSGRTITENEQIVREIRDRIAIEHTTKYLGVMKQLGMSREEIKKFIEKGN